MNEEELRAILKNLNYDLLAEKIKFLPKEFFEDLEIVKKELIDIERKFEKLRNIEENLSRMEDILDVLVLEITNLKKIIEGKENLDIKNLENYRKEIENIKNILSSFKGSFEEVEKFAKKEEINEIQKTISLLNENLNSLKSEMESIQNRLIEDLKQKFVNKEEIENILNSLKGEIEKIKISYENVKKEIFEIFLRNIEEIKDSVNRKTSQIWVDLNKQIENLRNYIEKIGNDLNNSKTLLSKYVEREKLEEVINKVNEIEFSLQFFVKKDEVKNIEKIKEENEKIKKDIERKIESLVSKTLDENFLKKSIEEIKGIKLNLINLSSKIKEIEEKISKPISFQIENLEKKINEIVNSNISKIMVKDINEIDESIKILNLKIEKLEEKIKEMEEKIGKKESEDLENIIEKLKKNIEKI